VRTAVLVLFPSAMHLKSLSVLWSPPMPAEICSRQLAYAVICMVYLVCTELMYQDVVVSM
jgi:hypothetical protein